LTAGRISLGLVSIKSKKRRRVNFDLLMGNDWGGFGEYTSFCRIEIHSSVEEILNDGFNTNAHH
jgi:hypothetical protein